MREIKFGVVMPTEDFPQAKAAAQLAEKLGFFSISFPDHFWPPFGPLGRRTPRMECYTMLTALAVVTERVRLVPSVSPIGTRHPSMLAKMITSIDHISNGRFIVGIGSGSMPDEFEPFGYPCPPHKVRTEQLAEGIKVMKALWTQEEPSFAGQHFRLDKAANEPKPVQRPHPPILMGGGSRSLLRIAAEEANIANLLAPNLEESAKRINTLKEFARAAGRDPEEIELSGFITVIPTVDAQRAAAVRLRLLGGGRQDRQDQLVGTVDEIKQGLAAHIEKLGMTYFILRIGSLEDLELFGTQIVPSFKR
jgi:probable F420-dependent oxidoreductase